MSFECNSGCPAAEQCVLDIQVHILAAEAREPSLPTEEFRASLEAIYTQCAYVRQLVNKKAQTY